MESRGAVDVCFEILDPLEHRSIGKFAAVIDVAGSIAADRIKSLEGESQRIHPAVTDGTSGFLAMEL